MDVPHKEDGGGSGSRGGGGGLAATAAACSIRTREQSTMTRENNSITAALSCGSTTNNIAEAASMNAEADGETIRGGLGEEEPH